MKVWVVEQGEYSDYRVVGVFSSRENAQLVADAINGERVACDATVAEWLMDPAVADLNAGRRPFVVHMLRDGTVERCEAWQITGYELAGKFDIWRRSEALAYAGTDKPDCLSATVWATDAEHAVKIVNEKRVQMIASGEWS